MTYSLPPLYKDLYIADPEKACTELIDFIQRVDLDFGFKWWTLFAIASQDGEFYGRQEAGESITLVDHLDDAMVWVSLNSAQAVFESLGDIKSKFNLLIITRKNDLWEYEFGPDVFSYPLRPISFHDYISVRMVI